MDTPNIVVDHGNLNGTSDVSKCDAKNAAQQQPKHKPLLDQPPTSKNVITNRFQPDHKFLTQLANKSPMCLVNEIARHHKLKQEYVLIDSIGPSHSKKFQVSLQFGKTEKFIGEGSSIKNAQRNAAIFALQNTRLRFPSVSSGNTQRDAQMAEKRTPTDVLNSVLMKRGIQPKYGVTPVETQRVPGHETNPTIVAATRNIPNINQYVMPLCSPLNFPTNFYYSPSKSIGFPIPLNQHQHQHHHHQHQPQQQQQQQHSIRLAHSQSDSSKNLINGYLDHQKYSPQPVPMMMIPATCVNVCYPHAPYFYPVPYHHHPLNNQPHMNFMYAGDHTSTAYGYNHREPMFINRSEAYNQNGAKPLPLLNQVPLTGTINRNSSSSRVSVGLLPTPVSENFKNLPKSKTFKAKVEFGGKQFQGNGVSEKEARHSAAQQALNFVNELDDDNSRKRNNKFTTSQRMSSSCTDTQSPICLIYEIASRNDFQVSFELLSATGQSHLPIFKMQCTIKMMLRRQDEEEKEEKEEKDDANLDFPLTVFAEDRSKKAAKKLCAEKMLNLLKEKLQIAENRERRKNHKILLKSPKSDVENRNSKSNSINGVSEQSPAATSSSSSSSSLSLSTSTSISCRFGSLLYQLSRNFSIAPPSYRSATIGEDNPLYAKYRQFLFATTTNEIDSVQSIKFQQVECALSFEQTLPEKLSISIKATGYGECQRMAKSISNYICLLKIGVRLSAIDPDASSCISKSLNFSLERNQGVPQNDSAIIDESLQPVDISTDETCGSTILPYLFPNSSPSGNDTSSMLQSIERNLQFVIHILSKIYLFALKDLRKPIDRLYEKMETAFYAFYSVNYPDYPPERIAPIYAKVNRLIDANRAESNKYWSHLTFISGLVSIDIDGEDDCVNLLRFKSHVIVSNEQQQQTLTNNNSNNKSQSSSSSSSPVAISIISAHRNALLCREFNFPLVKKNFVNFGLGSSDDSAREVAAYWTLKNLSYQARKQMIDGEFDEATAISDTTARNQRRVPALRVFGTGKKSQPSADQSTQIVMRSAVTSVAKSSSKHVTAMQEITKQCIARLFDACAELFIRKPSFVYTSTLRQSSSIVKAEEENKKKIDKNNDRDDNEDDANDDDNDANANTTELITATCVLLLNQEVPEPFATKIVVEANGPNNRIARTICAYRCLRKLGPIRVAEFVDLRKTLPNIDEYLRDDRPSDDNLDDRCDAEKSYSPVIRDEIDRNLQFLIRLLQEIYAPFLRNHKMACPAALFARVGGEFREYHNRQQQIMDADSGVFDRCSENINRCSDAFFAQYDGERYWHHLRMLFAIVSLLTGNLENPLDPPIMEVICRIVPTTATKNEDDRTEIESDDGPQPHIPAAIISLRCVSQSQFDACGGLARKTFLSYALSGDEERAREVASYKALRHLAINFWKRSPNDSVSE